MVQLFLSCFVSGYLLTDRRGRVLGPSECGDQMMSVGCQTLDLGVGGNMWYYPSSPLQDFMEATLCSVCLVVSAVWWYVCLRQSFCF